MNRIALAACLSITAFSLAACGDSTGDRALSGGGIGAGLGAVGGMMVGEPLEGAVIGGAIGASAGAISSPDKINLGKPIWR